MVKQETKERDPGNTTTERTPFGRFLQLHRSGPREVPVDAQTSCLVAYDVRPESEQMEATRTLPNAKDSGLRLQHAIGFGGLGDLEGSQPLQSYLRKSISWANSIHCFAAFCAPSKRRPSSVTTPPLLGSLVPSYQDV